MGPQLLKSLIRQTGEARDWPWDPWFTWQEAYPLHHGGVRQNIERQKRETTFNRCVKT